MKSSNARTKKRKIVVITGTRAEYGLLKSTMEAIQKNRKLQLQLVVTGMHLIKKFGHTIDDIRRDGWRIDASIKMQRGNDQSIDQAEGLSRGVGAIAKFLEQSQADIVVVLGDRIEAMAGALAAVTTGRILAHIHGGDVALGDFDDQMRHAITKLAHLHFPATRSAQRRIIKMGESKDRVHWVGAPGLDHLKQLTNRWNKSEEKSGSALVLHHPCGRCASKEKQTMDVILRAVERAGLKKTVIYPNSDRGHTGIIESIRHHQRHVNGTVKTIRSLDRDTYLQKLMEADVLVGNSSSGIIEASMAGTPVVNIGDRQKGRERSGPSVVDARETLISISRAIKSALRKKPVIGRGEVYGDGTAGVHIASLLACVSITYSLYRKCIAY